MISNKLINPATFEEAYYDSYVNNIVRKQLLTLSSFLNSDELESEKDYLIFYAYNTFNKEKSCFLTWITNVSRFYCLDKLRKLLKEPSYVPLFDNIDFNFSRNIKIQSCIGLLPDIQKKILIYKYWYRYTNKEIRSMLELDTTSFNYELELAKDNFKIYYLSQVEDA